MKFVKLTLVAMILVAATTSVATNNVPVSASAPAKISAADPPDTTPPATPGNFRLEGRTDTNLQLNWDWTTDNVGYVTQYELSYAGRTVLVDHYYPGHTLNVADLDLRPGHTYPITLKAIDQAGNRSQPTSLRFETTPPTRPSNLRLVSLREGSPDRIAFTAASDNAGSIRGYEVFFNGRSVRMTPGTNPEFSLIEQLYVIACVGAPIGPSTVQLRAFDSSLNPSPLSEPLTVVFP
jgi:hypothetical protein